MTHFKRKLCLTPEVGISVARVESPSQALPSSGSSSNFNRCDSPRLDMAPNSRPVNDLPSAASMVSKMPMSVQIASTQGWHSLPGGVRLVTRTSLAVINQCVGLQTNDVVVKSAIPLSSISVLDCKQIASL
jgi:hypothetical protein